MREDEILAKETVEVHWLFKEQMEDLCWLGSQVMALDVVLRSEGFIQESHNFLIGLTMKFLKGNFCQKFVNSSFRKFLTC